MPNACFRCRASIDSGETFCGSCRHEVDLDFGVEQTSRTWMIVAIVPALVPGLFVIETALSSVVGGSYTFLTVMVSLGSVILFGYALYADAGHVRRREDSDWTPNRWAYAAMAVLGPLLFVPIYPIAVYHLYRRKRAIGLSIR